MGLQRARNQALSAFAAHLSGDPNQQSCGQPISKGPRGSSREVLTAIRRCKRKWHCLTCACIAARKEADDLGDKIRRWSSLGGDIAFLTLTQGHQLGDPLDQLWLRLQSGWNAIVLGKQWDRSRTAFGLRGYVRITEIVHSPHRGWNVHYHVVLFGENQVWADMRLELMRKAIAERFRKGVRDEGGTAEPIGQSLVSYEEGSHQQLAEYCFKGLKIWRSNTTGARSPMAILDDLEAAGEGGDLWREFAKVAVGRHQKSESRGLAHITPSSAILP